MKYLSEISNAQIDNAIYINIVMLMYSLIEYSHNYSKTSLGLWQYYRDEPSNTTENYEPFQFKVNIKGNTPNDNNTDLLK